MDFDNEVGSVRNSLEPFSSLLLTEQYVLCLATEGRRMLTMATAMHKALALMDSEGKP